MPLLRGVNRLNAKSICGFTARLCGVIALCVIATGCGQKTAEPVKQAEATTQTGATKSTTEADFRPTRTIKYGSVYSETDQDASTLTGAVVNTTLGFGNVKHADPDNVTSKFSSQFNGCQPSEETDAIIPLRVTVKVDADASVTPVVLIKPGIGYELSVDAAADNGGAIGQCETDVTESGADGSSPELRSEFSPLGPGESHDRNWIFVVHDYYTPEHPDGQPIALGKMIGTAKVAFVTSTGDEAATSQTCYSGPREYPLLYQASGGAMNPGFSFTGDAYPGGEDSNGDDDSGLGGYKTFADAKRVGEKMPEC